MTGTHEDTKSDANEAVKDKDSLSYETKKKKRIHWNRTFGGLSPLNWWYHIPLDRLASRGLIKQTQVCCCHGGAWLIFSREPAISAVYLSWKGVGGGCSSLQGDLLWAMCHGQVGHHFDPQRANNWFLDVLIECRESRKVNINTCYLTRTGWVKHVFFLRLNSVCSCRPLH